MQNKETDHREEIARLNKIEGQIKGIRRMIQENRYCIDIISQLSAVAGAIRKIEENVLAKHLRDCVSEGFSKGTQKEREEKIAEISSLLEKFRR